MLEIRIRHENGIFFISRSRLSLRLQKKHKSSQFNGQGSPTLPGGYLDFFCLEKNKGLSQTFSLIPVFTFLLFQELSIVQKTILLYFE